MAYYGQSVIGHSNIMLARKSINKAIDQARKNEQVALVQQLELAKSLREFSSEELGLPDNLSYQSFVALDREFPVWNVVAAEEFSVQAKQWCYLVIGCASYRGYFQQASAEKYADRLRQKGLEALVQGVSAYSTLGWFADPILPTMFANGEADFAEVLFHELAHQVVYVSGDSDFNEAFATVVGEYGAKKWLAQHNPAALENYQRRLSAQRDFNRLLLDNRSRLADIYKSGASVSEMRKQKSGIFADMHHEYELIKEAEWSGQGWFDRWMSRALNNASLASIATYFEKVPILESIFVSCDRNLGRFYRHVKRMVNQNQLEALNVNCAHS